MFLNFAICISCLDDDVITLVVAIKRCQSLLIQVHIKLISIHPNFLYGIDDRKWGHSFSTYARRGDRVEQMCGKEGG